MGIEVSTMVDEKYGFFLEAVRQRLSNGFKDLVEVLSDGQGSVKINVSQTAPKFSTPKEVLKFFAESIKKLVQLSLEQSPADDHSIQAEDKFFDFPWTKLEADFVIEVLNRRFTFKERFRPIFELGESKMTYAEKILEEAKQYTLR